jgi:hypothetical protein
MHRRRLFLLLSALTLPGTACGRAAASVSEMSRIWREAAARDDTDDARCNDERRRLTRPLGEALRGRSREEATKLLGEPDLQPHTDIERFKPNNLQYSLGFCSDAYLGDYLSFVVAFDSGRVVWAGEAR